MQVGYDVDKGIAASAAAADIDLIVGGHSHTFIYGTPAPAGQPQLPGTPPPNITATTLEAAAEGPYPTNILNGGNKTIPVTTAFWGSRYVGDLSTIWLNGDLLNTSGSPVLLGGSAASHPVAGEWEWWLFLIANVYAKVPSRS
jgi:5'-nucleotidase